MPRPTPPTTDALIAIAREFYPAGLTDYDEGYRDTEEYRRLEERRAALSDDPRWPRLLDELRASLPDCELWDTTVLHVDASRRCRVYLPLAGPYPSDRVAVVALVSLIAPVYSLYLCHEFPSVGGAQSIVSEDFGTPILPYEAGVAQAVEAVYGYARMKPEVERVVVADRSAHHVRLGEATLFDLLFTVDRN